jgi:uncharacterized protein
MLILDAIMSKLQSTPTELQHQLRWRIFSSLKGRTTNSFRFSGHTSNWIHGRRDASQQHTIGHSQLARCLRACYHQRKRKLETKLMTDLKGNIFFAGPAGRIEAILKEPGGTVTRVAIACHPHPLFGGTMHNKVVFRIARTFEDAGFAVLRFNFRGAGRSEGSHDNGLGEQDDLLSAIKFMEEKYPGAEIWLAGFSFGAAVMLRAAARYKRARALVAVGLPVSKHDFSEISNDNRPKLFVQGSLDEFGSPADLERLFDSLAPPKQLEIIEGANHFFDGRLPELARAISQFIASVESKPAVAVEG